MESSLEAMEYSVCQRKRGTKGEGRTTAADICDIYMILLLVDSYSKNSTYDKII